MGNDVDDVLALDMLYKYQDAGKIRLLLISNNKGNAYSAPFIQLMNDFYGWSGIPVASSPAELLPQQKEKQPSYVEVVAASGIFPVSSAETFDSVEKIPADPRGTTRPQRRNRFRRLPVQSQTAAGFGSGQIQRTAGQRTRRPQSPAADHDGRQLRRPAAQGIQHPHRHSRSPRRLRPLADRHTGQPVGSGRADFLCCAALDKISYAAQHPLKMAYASYLPLPYDRECWDQTAVMAGVEELGKVVRAFIPRKSRSGRRGTHGIHVRAQRTHPDLADDSRTKEKSREIYHATRRTDSPKNTRPGNNLPAECTSNDSGGRNFCCRCRLSMASRNSQFLLIFSHNQS